MIFNLIVKSYRALLKSGYKEKKCNVANKGQKLIHLKTIFKISTTKLKRDSCEHLRYARSLFVTVVSFNFKIMAVIKAISFYKKKLILVLTDV